MSRRYLSGISEYRQGVYSAKIYFDAGLDLFVVFKYEDGKPKYTIEERHSRYTAAADHAKSWVVNMNEYGQPWKPLERKTG